MIKQKRQAPFDHFAVRIIQYILGFITLPFGIVMVLSTNLGAGPWDTTSYNLSALLNITLGMSSAIVNASVMAIVMVYRRKWRYVFMLVPILGIASFLDFWDLVVFSNIAIDNLIMGYKLIIFVVGTFFITLGLTMIIQSDFPAGVFDELMIMIMDVFNTENIFFSRLAVETLAITLALIFGFIGGIGFGAVNYGSVFLAILLAPLLSLQINWMGRFVYE